MTTLDLKLTTFEVLNF